VPWGWLKSSFPDLEISYLSKFSSWNRSGRLSPPLLKTPKRAGEVMVEPGAENDDIYRFEEKLSP